MYLAFQSFLCIFFLCQGIQKGILFLNASCKTRWPKIPFQTHCSQPSHPWITQFWSVHSLRIGRSNSTLYAFEKWQYEKYSWSYSLFSETWKPGVFCFNRKPVHLKLSRSKQAAIAALSVIGCSDTGSEPSFAHCTQWESQKFFFIILSAKLEIIVKIQGTKCY